MNARIKQEALEADRKIAELAQAAAEAAKGEPLPIVEAQPELPIEPAPVVEAQPTPTPPDLSGEVAQLRDALAKSEQRYRSLDGMLAQRDRTIESLQQLIANMQAAPAPQPEAKPKSKLVTEKDESEFGADLIDMIRRAAREETEALRAQNESLQATVKQLQGELQGVSTVTATTAQARFEEDLSRVAPQWRTLDSDPAFIAWLQGHKARHKLFAEALQSRDAEEIGYYFNEFARINAPAPAPAAPATPSPAAALERQVAPGRSAAVPTPANTQGQKKHWTRSEIQAVYSNKKQYSSEDFARLERDIAAAQRENRVDFTR